MDSIVPWRKLCRLIEPHYPRGERGRSPIGIDRMPAAFIATHAV